MEASPELNRSTSIQLPPYPDRFQYAAAFAGLGVEGAEAPPMTDDTRLILYALYQQVHCNQADSKIMHRS